MSRTKMRAVIDKYSSLPFGYGETDCCQFVAECVDASNGRDVMEGLLYSDEQSAMNLIESYGSLEKLVTAKLGEPYGGSKNGDIVVFNQANGTQIAGVVYGGVAVVRTVSGLMDWPIECAVGVWET